MENHGKSLVLIGKSTISMGQFSSSQTVNLPEATCMKFRQSPAKTEKQAVLIYVRCVWEGDLVRCRRSSHSSKSINFLTQFLHHGDRSFLHPNLMETHKDLFSMVVDAIYGCEWNYQIRHFLLSSQRPQFWKPLGKSVWNITWNQMN